MRAKEFIIEAISLDKIRAAGGPETPANRDLSDRLKQSMSSKPPNFVAKNAKMGGAGAHKDAKKATKEVRGQKHKNKEMAEETVNELSNQLLGRYKKAAGADASAADKAGNFEKGDKRFKGIVKATIKQGENDSKKHKEKDVKEAAPPTAKGERMVKHIKKGYTDDGELTDKERSIAYATAWKAHNKS
jgi:hypothetical protein